MDLQIETRSDQAKGFVVLPTFWIGERTFGWLEHCRRLAKDFENMTSTQLALVQLAKLLFMMRRVTRVSHSS